MHRLDPPPRDADFQPSSPRKPHPKPNSLPPNPTGSSTPKNAGKSPTNTKPTRHSQERTRITHNAELAEWANDPKNKNPQEFKKALIFTVFLSSLTLAVSWSVANNVVFPYLKKTNRTTHFLYYLYTHPGSHSLRNPYHHLTAITNNFIIHSKNIHKISTIPGKTYKQILHIFTCPLCILRRGIRSTNTRIHKLVQRTRNQCYSTK